MEIYEKIIDQIDDEIDVAFEYYDMCKEYPHLKSVYMELARDEVNHAEKLVSTIVYLASKVKETTPDVEYTRRLWDYEYKDISKRIDKIKWKLEKCL